MLLRIHNNQLSKLIDRMSGGKVFYIYEGEIPTVDKNFVFHPANYSDRLLAKFSQGLLSSSSSVSLSTTGVLSSFIPLKTGTATWFALPVSDTSNGWPSAIIGSITNISSSNDPLLLSAINLVSGEQQSVIDFKFKLGA